MKIEKKRIKKSKQNNKGLWGLIGPATNLPKNHASNHKDYITSFGIEFNCFDLLLL